MCQISSPLSPTVRSIFPCTVDFPLLYGYNKVCCGARDAAFCHPGAAFAWTVSPSREHGQNTPRAVTQPARPVMKGGMRFLEHYLDYAATTPVRPEAAQAALSAMTEGFYNPSSRYAPARQAAQRLEEHRAVVASALGARPEEIVFTSCGTESDNWAIQAAIRAGRHRGRHIVTTAVEHSAVLEPIRALEREGCCSVTWLQPDRSGHIAPEQVAAALREDTVLVSMMLVNNEVGTLLPVAEAARAIRESGCPALLHCDAVQGFLKVPFTAKELGVDLLSISGHKIGAPKGIGALYLRRGLKLSPLMLGGGQESGLRPGTEPTAQIAAFAAAVRAGQATLSQDLTAMAELKEYGLRVLAAALPQLKVISPGDAPHIFAVTLPGYKSEVLVRFLSDRGIYLSSGSACHRGKPSHVFAALGLPKPWLDGALRISLSPRTARADLDALAEGLTAAREQLFSTLS